MGLTLICLPPAPSTTKSSSLPPSPLISRSSSSLLVDRDERAGAVTQDRDLAPGMADNLGAGRLAVNDEMAASCVPHLISIIPRNKYYGLTLVLRVSSSSSLGPSPESDGSYPINLTAVTGKLLFLISSLLPSSSLSLTLSFFFSTTFPFIPFFLLNSSSCSSLLVIALSRYVPPTLRPISDFMRSCSSFLVALFFFFSCSIALSASRTVGPSRMPGMYPPDPFPD